MEQVPCVGIDLGSSFSSVCIFKDGVANVILDDISRGRVPSCVSFSEHERLIGYHATKEFASSEVIYDSKRLIGKSFDDAEVMSDKQHLPYNIVDDRGRIKIETEFKKEKKILFPEEVSSMILMRMKEYAEVYLQQTITEAVVTVPSTFNNVQRQAIMNAGKICGLSISRLLNDTSAAALAFSFHNKFDHERNVLIFDLGGGYLDVSVVRIDQSFCEVLSTCGNSHGGQDFNHKMLIYLINIFRSETNIDISYNLKAMRKLRKNWEKAKIILSSSDQTLIEIPSLCDHRDFSINITRITFEKQCNNLFMKILEPVEKCLKDIKMDKSSISDVVLIGGSTRMPKIRRLIQNFFNGKELNQSIHLHESVAHGAAIQAAILLAYDSKFIKESVVADITSSSFSLGNIGDNRIVLAPMYTTIPQDMTLAFTTDKKDQSEIPINVFQGKNVNDSQDILIGTLNINEIPPAPAGVPQTIVTFAIDGNGIINASATILLGDTGNRLSNTIETDKGMSKEEIIMATCEAKKFMNEDKLKKKRIRFQTRIELLAHNNRSRVADSNLEEKINILNEIDNVIDWIRNNQYADVQEYKEKYFEFSGFIKKVVLTLTYFQ